MNHCFLHFFLPLGQKMHRQTTLGETYPSEENVRPPGTAVPHPWRGALEAAKGSRKATRSAEAARLDQRGRW